MTIEQITVLLGWCTLLNAIILIITTIGLKLAGNKVIEIHGRMFGVDTAELSKIYFTYLANFKMLVILFNLVPYIALLIIT